MILWKFHIVVQIKKGPRFKIPIGGNLLLARINHIRGGLSWLSINNGRIPWFRDKTFLEWALFGGFRTRRYFVTLPGNGQEAHLKGGILQTMARKRGLRPRLERREKPKWSYG